MRKILFVLFLATLAGCDIPTQDQVKSDFAKTDPGCTILTVDPGEGDDQHVYIGITYTCKGSEKELFREELYRLENGLWIHIPTTHSSKLPRIGF
jgi:hypothetical protein